MIKLIVFDFDGTLVDSWKVVEKSIRESVGDRGYEISKSLLNVVRNTPIEKTLETIISDSSHIREIIGDSILKKKNRFKEVRKVRNVEVLKEIKLYKIILSNSVTPFIEKVLSNLKIDFFDEVYGSDKFESKEKKLKKIISKRKLKVDEVVYVGDRPIDVELTRKVGCICVAISGKASWSSRDELLKEEPDFLISNLGDLKKIIKKL